MNDRDWDKDFDLADWQALDPTWRKEWIEKAWAAERDDQDSYEIYRIRQSRYERGQTAWDIDLEPQPFDITLSEAVGQVKPEHWDGRIFGSRDVRYRVLSALLANTGLRRTVRLAPRRLWEAVVLRQSRWEAYERALAADRAEGTSTARYEPTPRSEPIVRPEFVTSDQPDVDGPFYWVRHLVAQPFHTWDMEQHRADIDAMRTLELGYVRIGEHTLARTDLLVLRGPWRTRRNWPTASNAALAMYVANGEGPLAFDWNVRRPIHFQAGTEELWVIDTRGRRILRQRRGEPPNEVRYSDPGQTVSWRHESDEVVVKLNELFDHLPETGYAGQPVNFKDFNAAQLARLERFETPWTVGYTPQWFNAPIGELLVRFKDELWEGTLFGPDHARDALLSALLANVGLDDVVQLAPLELWQHALAEDRR